MKKLEQVLKDYLDKRAAQDPQFAAKYANPKKSIKECARYIIGEACDQQEDGVAGFTDEELHSLAVHYYDEDDIKVKPIRGGVHISRSEAAYAKYIKRYRSIELKGRGITIYPLPSVAAFFEEGEAMRHCVYSNGYYKDRTILILSARNDKGDRLATIEYALKTGKIRQCRSKCNGIPERDAEIRELITNNRKVFTRAMTAAN